MYRKLATVALVVIVAVNAYDAGRYVADPSMWSYIGLHAAAYLIASAAALAFAVKRAL